MGRINGDLVVGLIPLFHTQIVVFQINIEIGQDQFILDDLPDDACHLVAVELYNGIVYLDLCHDGSLD